MCVRLLCLLKRFCGILKCLCFFSADSRQKEKKTAKTRSKVKSSDEDGSPKSAQKKVKLLQPYVVYLLSSLL